MFNRHFDPFNLLIDPETKTIFVLNPKVMTTFVRTVLRAGFAEFRGGVDMSNNRYRLLSQARNFPLHPLSTYARLCFTQDDYDVFSMVRNPFSRTISAWKNKFYDPHVQGGGKAAAYPLSMRKGELRSFRRFARAHGLEGAEEGTLVPFSTFMARIEAQKEGRRNHHWDTQSSVIQGHHFAFTRIFRMEDERKACLLTLFSRLGFDHDWIQSRLARPENKSSSPSHIGYDAATAAQARKIFAPDFDAFGYSLELPPKLAQST